MSASCSSALVAAVARRACKHSPDDADNWHETDSFSGTKLLRIAHLAGRAYDRVSELRQQERSNDSRMAS